MDTETRPTGLKTNTIFRPEKEKNNGKETRHQRSQDSLHCPKDTLIKPNTLQTGLFQPKIIKYKRRAFNRKIEIKPIPILLNVSLTTNNHF